MVRVRVDVFGQKEHNMDHLYLGMVNAIVSIGGLGFIVWSHHKVRR